MLFGSLCRDAVDSLHENRVALQPSADEMTLFFFTFAGDVTTRLIKVRRLVSAVARHETGHAAGGQMDDMDCISRTSVLKAFATLASGKGMDLLTTDELKSLAGSTSDDQARDPPPLLFARSLSF